jgi:hypothetical protein
MPRISCKPPGLPATLELLGSNLASEREIGGYGRTLASNRMLHRPEQELDMEARLRARRTAGPSVTIMIKLLCYLISQERDCKDVHFGGILISRGGSRDR